VNESEDQASWEGARAELTMQFGVLWHRDFWVAVGLRSILGLCGMLMAATCSDRERGRW
jgi:hypothetical protein